jgi:hypothetical protein
MLEEEEEEEEEEERVHHRRCGLSPIPVWRASLDGTMYTSSVVGV